MRFMMMVLLDPKGKAEKGEMPDAKLVEAMMKYNEELSKAGVLLALDGLHPTSKGTRVKFSGGKAAVVDGPFAEAKEVVGGYWILQVKSREEAVEWAKRCPAPGGDEDCQVELRKIFEAADFGPEIAEKEAPLAKAIASNLAKNAQG